MQQYGKAFYRRFAADCVEDIRYRDCGIAFVYLDRDVWESVAPRVEQAPAWGAPLDLLGRERAAALLPELDYDRIVAVVFKPDAVRLRAGDAIRALARQLERRGAALSCDTRVWSRRSSASPYRCRAT